MSRGGRDVQRGDISGDRSRKEIQGAAARSEIRMDHIGRRNADYRNNKLGKTEIHGRVSR